MTDVPAGSEIPVELTFELNGETRTVGVEPWLSLLEALRDRLGLAGAKQACGLGECGACTVHVDGRPVVACLMPALQAGGRRVTTIEGLSRDGLTPLQAALVRHGALQCGFCTPGLVMMGTAILAELEATGEPASDAAIRRRLAGNLCRCTGYTKIVQALLEVLAR